MSRIHKAFEWGREPFSRKTAFGIFVVLFSLLFGLFTLQTGTSRVSDPHILGFIATTFLILASIMIVGTKEWRWRSLGVLCVFLGDALLYGYTATNSLVAAIHFSERAGEIITDAVRALFIIGGVLLLTNSFVWWYTETELEERVLRAKQWTNKFDRKCGLDKSSKND